MSLKDPFLRTRRSSRSRITKKDCPARRSLRRRRERTLRRKKSTFPTRETRRPLLDPALIRRGARIRKAQSTSRTLSDLFSLVIPFFFSYTIPYIVYVQP